MLVESSRNQNQEVPALLYTVNAVWFMASPPDSIMDRKARQVKEEEEVVGGSENSNHSRSTGREGGVSFSSSHTSALDAPFSTSAGASRSSSTIALVSSTINDQNTIELRDRIPSARSSNSPRGEGSPSSSRRGQPTSAEPADQVRRTHSQSGGDHSQGDDEDEDGNVVDVRTVLISLQSAISNNLSRYRFK